MSLFQHKPHSHRPVNVNDAHAEELSASNFNTKLAVRITQAFGNIWAFYALVAWMLIWMGLATLGVWLFAFDKYPFPFLLFCSNLVQLWALPVLAVGQNVLGRKQELQSNEQYNTTIKTYHDIEEVMKHLAVQDEELLKQTQLLLELLQGRERHE